MNRGEPNEKAVEGGNGKIIKTWKIFLDYLIPLYYNKSNTKVLLLCKEVI